MLAQCKPNIAVYLPKNDSLPLLRQKEQAENDFQNLVCCIMVEQNIELQDAIDVLTDMLDARVTEYLDLKNRLPSFGEAVDAQLARYLSALEHFVQGTVVWYYRSPRKSFLFTQGMDSSHPTIKVISPIRSDVRRQIRIK